LSEGWGGAIEYIERLGTGTVDIVRIAKEEGLKEPEFIQDDSFKTILYRPSTVQVPKKYRRSSVVLP
jgi:ATP-dependent DNA helicase RecG